MIEPVVIAIDGPAGAGKSTVARQVAARLGFLYVDSGATYRAAALKVLESGVPMEDSGQVIAVVVGADIRLSKQGLDAGVLLDGEDISSRIRTPDVSMAASKVARLAEVRLKMVSLQRSSIELAREGNARGVVMEGRDIGTVVFPDAPLKIFLKADPEERARRRLNQDRLGGHRELNPASLAQTAHEIVRRDKSDSERRISPLAPAADACEIDSTHLTVDQVVGRILRMAERRGLIGRADSGLIREV